MRIQKFQSFLEAKVDKTTRYKKYEFNLIPDKSYFKGDYLQRCKKVVDILEPFFEKWFLLGNTINISKLGPYGYYMEFLIRDIDDDSDEIPDDIKEMIIDDIYDYVEKMEDIGVNIDEDGGIEDSFDNKYLVIRIEF